MLRKLLVTLNVIFVFLLLGIIVASYNFEGTSGIFSMLQLVTPYIFGIHLLFFFLWLFIDRKWALLSLASLIIAFSFLGAFFKLNTTVKSKGQISVMTYNVMLFNKFGWIPIPNAGDKIISFIKDKNPDILCIQEYNRERWRDLTQYPYITQTPYNISRSIQAIFSKFPIAGEGSLNPPGSQNNIIYADVLFKKDTIRIYNVHLESFKINLSNTEFSEESSRRVFSRMKSTFRAQLEQAKILKDHIAQCPYEVIIGGDFNNTQFSNVYRILSSGMKDSFLSEGRGLGKTYSIKGIPMRIDYIFADNNFDIMAHTNYDVQLSDHYPVMATMSLKPTE